ncbi:uncharacterized protein TA05605 [Theileria annulata]|uniref:Uncharacterized protein n=1 Tax=Theileria annulata TaxID=5874 RepID=Q4UHM6_THEAN|nr:uncharacterized protein TA05605 [Theileria annulata]CAI73413.1 hypothetical protein, conserved [Theileria annulata]|eukprot:XP_954090.1 hypothetical protein, conserved [Theileria annulata]
MLPSTYRSLGSLRCSNNWSTEENLFPLTRSIFNIYFQIRACRIPHPNYIIVDHILVKKGIYKFEEQYDYIIYNGIRLNKPFIEKPIDSDDHNNWIYYPLNSGGGCKKLFRKNGDRSSNYYPEIHNVRRDSIYIYQEFVSNFGTDIKVYSVGPLFAHAESRKSPTLDGKVDRYPDGKEIRYPVILTGKEKIIAYRIVDHFKQLVCGFDILRTFDGPYVCDVNGWSFVKRNYKYLIDCSNILRIILLLKLQKKFNIIIPNLVQERQVDEIIKKTFADVKSYHKEELCSVVVIMRHADRKPKNKLKFYTKNSYIINYFKGITLRCLLQQ